MAKIGVLIDTDIFIDALKNVKCARELFRTSEVERYCSILSKKELLSKGGLKDSERKKILDMLGKARVLRIDDDIHRKFFSLTKKYGVERTYSQIILLPQPHGRRNCHC